MLERKNAVSESAQFQVLQFEAQSSEKQKTRHSDMFQLSDVEKRVNMNNAKTSVNLVTSDILVVKKKRQ